MSTFNMAPIMEAFFEGVNLARRKKEWADQQEQAKLEFEQQKVRDKALDDYRKSSLEQDKRRIDLTAADQKAERARRTVEAYNQGELQLPGGVSGLQTPDIRSALLGNVLQGLNLPEIQGSGDLQVPGTENEFVSASQIPSYGNRTIDIANRWKEQQQLYNQQRLDQAMQIAQAQIGSREKEGAANRATRLQAAQISAANKGSGENRQVLKDVDRIVGDIRKDKIFKAYNDIDNGLKLVKNRKPDPKAPGIYDTNLLYQYISIIDWARSTVREGEVQLLERPSASLAQRFGFKLENIHKPGQLLSQEARNAMIAEMQQAKNQVALKLKQYINGSYVRANRIDPSLKKDLFLQMIKGGKEEE